MHFQPIRIRPVAIPTHLPHPASGQWRPRVGEEETCDCASAGRALSSPDRVILRCDRRPFLLSWPPTVAVPPPPSVPAPAPPSRLLRSRSMAGHTSFTSPSPGQRPPAHAGAAGSRLVQPCSSSSSRRRFSSLQVAAARQR
jgi:hypothetical protein